jgi:hypothetical protein
MVSSQMAHHLIIILKVVQEIFCIMVHYRFTNFVIICNLTCYNILMFVIQLSPQLNQGTLLAEKHINSKIYFAN